MTFTDERIREELGKCPDPWAVAEHLVDQEVASGEYEGCSSQLEMAFTEYERRAKRILADTFANAGCDCCGTNDRFPGSKFCADCLADAG